MNTSNEMPVSGSNELTEAPGTAAALDNFKELAFTVGVGGKIEISRNGADALTVNHQNGKIADLNINIENVEVISMREALTNANSVESLYLLASVFPEHLVQFNRAFPIPGETETMKTYLEYLVSKSMMWDCVILREVLDHDAEQGRVIGGAHFQFLDGITDGPIKSVVWAEHIYAVEGARNAQIFMAIGGAVKEAAQKLGADAVIMEYNDLKKMTPEDIAVDCSAGLHPAIREVLWHTHLKVLRFNDKQTGESKIAASAQPSMGEDLPPVEFLSNGFLFLKDVSTVPRANLESILTRMWETIPGVTVGTDPTAQKVFSELRAAGDEFYVGRLIADESGTKPDKAEIKRRLKDPTLQVNNNDDSLEKMVVRVLVPNKAEVEMVQ